MSPIVEKERELSLYLEEWITARYSDWKDFYDNTFQERRNGIYRLNGGEELMSLLNDIMGNIEDHLYFEDNTHIIPSRFSSIPQLLQFLESFNNHLKSSHPLIEMNVKGEATDTIILEIYRICNDIDQMVTRCLCIYQTDHDIPIPYMQAKDALGNYNVQLFVELIRSLIKNIPYTIHKEKLDEGYFHTVVHVITSFLGMSPISEAATDDGRIDMMIEYPSHIYILEFKYSKEGHNLSQNALNQIKEKEYAEAYFFKGKPIDGVGMSFSQSTRNVEYYVSEHLYTPSISIY